MSTRSIRQVLVVAFGLSLSSVALARNPPALVKQQEAAAHAVKTSNGYRDMNVRFATAKAQAPTELREAGGYRGMNVRF